MDTFRHSRHRRWLPAAVILLLSLAGFLVFHSGISERLVRQQLDGFAAGLRQEGLAEGRDVTLTYGAVEIAGGISSRHAVIHDPRLVIKTLNAPVGTPQKPNSLLITAPEMKIYPRRADLSAMDIELDPPFLFSSEENPTNILLQIDTGAPYDVGIEPVALNGVASSRIHHVNAGALRLKYLREQQAQGAEDATPTIVPVYETLVVSLARNEWDMTFAQDGSGLGQGSIAMSDIVIAPENIPESAIRIGHVDGRWSDRLNPQKQKVLDSSFAIDAVTAPQQIISYAPIAFHYDVSYTGTMPSSPEQAAQLPPQGSSFTLKSFELRTKDAALTASADFAATADDALPVGHARVTLTNFPFVVDRLKQNNLLSPQNEGLLDDMVTQIAGTSYKLVHDLDIPVARAHGSAFTIGKTTFEELFTIFLKSKLQRIAAPATPAMTEVPHGRK